MSILQRSYDLSHLNSFGVKARATTYASPSDTSELERVLDSTESKNLLLLGEGFNLLFTRDFPGLVLNPGFRGIEVQDETENEVVVKVGAAENWDRWVEYATSQAWYGLENLSLIPGSVGAAPVQNIGAYGAELKDSFKYLEAWDLKRQRLVILDKNDCKFSYRDSIFKKGPDTRYIILNVSFSLHKKAELNLAYGPVKKAFEEAGGSSAMDLREVIIDIRRSKLPEPEDYGNAGSFFKNPVIEQKLFESLKERYKDMPHFPDADNKVKIPAAWLIQQSGWKGKREGQVGTWPLQPLVLVNYGGASGQDIFEFSQKIIEDVAEKTGIRLEREVRVI